MNCSMLNGSSEAPMSSPSTTVALRTCMHQQNDSDRVMALLPKKHLGVNGVERTCDASDDLVDNDGQSDFVQGVGVNSEGEGLDTLQHITLQRRELATLDGRDGLAESNHKMAIRTKDLIAMRRVCMGWK
jgi:hypothetical protein